MSCSFLRKLSVVAIAVVAVGYTLAGGASASTGAKENGDDASAEYATETIRGRVVWLAEALQRRFGVKTVAEAGERVLALETAEGRLVPLVEDVRGRSFRNDKRLRGIDVELLVKRYDGSPLVQVIKIFQLKKDGKYELDYWCEICAIAMYELKECDCCQGPIELRLRKAADQDR